MVSVSKSADLLRALHLGIGYGLKAVDPMLVCENINNCTKQRYSTEGPCSCRGMIVVIG